MLQGSESISFFRLWLQTGDKTDVTVQTPVRIYCKPDWVSFTAQ
jgi:hypothetical protein